MKTTQKSLIAVIYLICSAIAQGQESNLKSGKITADEISMSVYKQDTTTSAVVLNKNGYARYCFMSGEFIVEYYYESRIKILKSEGTAYANITIPLYQSEKTVSDREQISKIEAYAYNLEKGKIIKTRMGKEYIFEERISPNMKQIKFSIPSVKTGTVIEYKYKISSNQYYSLHDWNIQKFIPVANARCEILIPEYFKFSIASKGFEFIKTEDTFESQSFSINLGNGQTESINSNSRKLVFTAKDVLALKNESNVWCLKISYRA